MIKKYVYSIATAIGIAATLASADAAAQVKAFGFTLGETTTQEALKLGARNGTNAYSDGPMVTIPAQRFDVTGLESMLLIFDTNDRLAAISLGMSKHQFDSVHGHLSGSYAVREQQIPFVGNRLVRYGAPGATILLDAPHMSFSMTVLYARDDFHAEFKRRQQRDQQNQKQRERSHF